MASVRYTVDNNHCTTEIHKIVVYKFTVATYDVDEVHDSELLDEWRQSDPGKFVLEHAVTKPVIIKNEDISLFQVQYAIVAELEKKKLSEFYMKWGKNGNNQA